MVRAKANLTSPPYFLAKPPSPVLLTHNHNVAPDGAVGPDRQSCRCAAISAYPKSSHTKPPRRPRPVPGGFRIDPGWTKQRASPSCPLWRLNPPQGHRAKAFPLPLPPRRPLVCVGNHVRLWGWPRAASLCQRFRACHYTAEVSLATRLPISEGSSEGKSNRAMRLHALGGSLPWLGASGSMQRIVGCPQAIQRSGSMPGELLESLLPTSRL